MYPWKNLYTWNPLAGECSNGCRYCYVIPQKRKPVLNAKYSGPPRVLDRELKQNLGEGRIIFVESMSDLFAEDVPSECIIRILEHCMKYPKNRYLLQSKNPKRFEEFFNDYISRMNVILGTTLETDEYYDKDMSKAPTPAERAKAMGRYAGCMKMISIEPVMRFDILKFGELIKEAAPDFVSIGADSQNNNLKEPPVNDIFMLIGYLLSFTKVKLKPNLDLIVGSPSYAKLFMLTDFDISDLDDLYEYSETLIL
jgi:DNA repair photolyase